MYDSSMYVAEANVAGAVQNSMGGTPAAVTATGRSRNMTGDPTLVFMVLAAAAIGLIVFSFHVQVDAGGGAGKGD
jgi:hypothetical protein